MLILYLLCTFHEHLMSRQSICKYPALFRLDIFNFVCMPNFMLILYLLHVFDNYREHLMSGQATCGRL